MYNNSTSDVTGNVTVHEPRWALIGLAVIPAWILFGNLMVLLAVLCHRNLRTLSNWVIASLAATDFMLALIVVPGAIYQLVNGHWDLGLITCLVWTGSDVFLSTTSIMHLCAIAIHRFLGISYPLHFRSRQEKRHVMALLAPAWCISAAISLPLIVQGATKFSPVLVHGQCGIFDRTFTIYSSMVSFFLPLAVMVVADTRSVQILRKNTKVSIITPSASSQASLRSHRTVSSKEASAYELTGSDVGNDVSHDTANDVCESNAQSPMVETRVTSCQTSEQDLMSVTLTPQSTPRCETMPAIRGRSRSKSMGYIGMLATRGKLNSRERRAEKTLIWVFVCFVALWTPFFVTNLTYGICHSCQIPDAIFLCFTWLGYISSGVNPCIYTFLNKDFRNAFKRILLCRGSELSRKPTT